jgi:hypothetical protein
MSNITVEDWNDTQGRVYTPVLKDGELKNMVTHVAAEFPDWQFVGKADHYSYEHTKDSTGGLVKTFSVTSYDVRSNNTTLGKLSTTSWGASRYVIDNERISLRRERGSGMKSADLKKVVKNMKKYFTELTLPEKLAKSFSKAEGALSDLIRSRGYEYRRAIETVGNAVEHQLKEPHSYAKVYSLLVGMGLDDKATVALNNIPDYTQDYVNTEALRNAYQREDSQQRASFVFIENSKYVFVRRDKRDKAITREAENIHPSVRESLGLLKLMPDGAFLPNKGLRIDEKVFIVFDDLPLEE